MIKRLYPFIFAALLLLMSSQFAAAAAGWVGLRSGNLFITGQKTEAELRMIAGRLEKFRSALGSLSPRLRSDMGQPVNVLVFPDDPAFANFGLKRENGVFDESVAGYFVRGEDANFIAISGRARASDPYHTIYHEYVHNLLRSRGSSEIPAWLNEGLAQYLETAEFTSDGKVALGLAPKGRLELLAKSELIPLKRLLSATNEEVHSGGTPRTVFYAQSWLLVHHLLAGASGPAFGDRLERLFELAADQASIEKLLSEKASEATPEAALRAYAASRPASQVYESRAEDVPLSEAVSEPVSSSAADALLGELLVRLGRPAEAEVLIRRALAADKASLRANSSLGEILAVKGMYQEARNALEAAERAGELGPAALFYLAYSLIKETADKDQLIGKIPANTAERARGYLRRSIHLRPAFAEPYKLLGHISLINNDQLREAAASLLIANALKPSDAELRLMLAKTYLRLEQYADASAAAAAVAAGSADPSIKKEALEIQNASSEYRRASVDLTAGAARTAPKSMLFLKRSWLSDDDLRQIELNREMNNLNGVLDRPRAGEVQVLGSIDRIACSEGSIIYSVVSGGAPMKLWGSKFDDLRLAVLVHGMHSFKLDCGARFAGQKAVLLYKPAEAGSGVSRQRLTSITFVPENFQLMSPEDVAAARLVVVEDDMRLRGRERDSILGYARVTDAERLESIRNNLRKPGPLEKQIVAKLGRVECPDGSIRIKATAAGSEWQFTTPSPNSVAVNWFTSKGLNFRLACGAEPNAANVLLTYKPNSTGGPHELTAIEFLPPDLSPIVANANSIGQDSVLRYTALSEV